MTVTGDLAPAWGLAHVTPAGALAAWGARMIVTQDGTTDLVWDRTGWDGSDAACEALQARLNGGLLADVRATLADLLRSGIMSTRQGGVFTMHQGSDVTVVADTRGSAGYCYVTAFLAPVA